MKSNLWWGFQIPTLVDRFGKLKDSLPGWVGLLSEPFHLKKKKKALKIAVEFSCVFFSAGEITQFYKWITVSWEQTAKFNSNKHSCPTSRVGWGWGELGPKVHHLPHFHWAYQIPKCILNVDLWNVDNGMRGEDCTKKTDVTNYPGVCCPVGQTSM